MQSGLVLVTGANGFVGKWCVLELLRAGYSVRGTVRSEGRAEAVRTAVREHLGEGALTQLSFVLADLTRDGQWSKAVWGVDAIMHVASPVLANEPVDADEVVGPALEGTERLFRFAIAAGVKRFVMTASVATIGYGLGQVGGERTYTEADFTDLDGIRRPWADCIGKTRAERTAWAYARAEDLALTTIHPGVILGPALDRDVSASLQLVSRLLDGSAAAMPSNGVCVVDVRDVAAMHVTALQNPQSVGQRYIAASGYLAFADIAGILRRAYSDRQMTPKTAPDWLISLKARFGQANRQVINDIGTIKLFDGRKGEALLGRAYINPEQAVLSTAESVIRLGLVE